MKNYYKEISDKFHSYIEREYETVNPYFGKNDVSFENKLRFLVTLQDKSTSLCLPPANCSN